MWRANSLIRTGKEFQPLVPPRGSVAASVQAVLPKSYVAAGLHHVPAKALGDLDHPIESDVLICSDFPAASQAPAGLVQKFPNLRPLACGELSLATPLESFTHALRQLNWPHTPTADVQFTSTTSGPRP